VIASGASGATGAVAATAGNASIAAANFENTDALVVSAARVGQAGGAAAATSAVNTSAVGGNGITVTPLLDNGANTASIKFIGNADITGGAGGASATPTGSEADVGGAGGTALSASMTETLNIEIAGTQASTGTADVVRFTAGAGGAAGTSGTSGTAGAAGSSVVIGANGTINITDSLSGATAALYNGLDLGTVVGTNANINASSFHGALTVTAADGNTVITSGSAADTLGGGTGINTMNAGLGNDIVTGGDGADVLAGGGGRDAFFIVTEAHSDTVAYDKIADFGKATSAMTAAEVAAMSDQANFVATATAKGGVEADFIDFFNTASIGAAASGTNVSDFVIGGSGTCTASISAKGIITLAGTNIASVDTLVEWTDIAHTMINSAQFRVAAFEFSGNTYVQEYGGVALTTDDLVQLTGVTGVTGIVALGGSVAAAVGDIFVL
jgi:hypothetical protein